MTHRPPRLAFVVVCLFFAWVPASADPVNDVPASVRPIPLTDESLVLAVPAIARPALRSPIPDPAFGTTITRITGDTGTPLYSVAGTWGADARHTYSKQQPWNADGTLLVVQNRGAGTPSKLFLDGTTYVPKFGPCSNDPLYDYRWHPARAHANTMINVSSSGTELMWYDVVTCTKTRSWPLPITASYGIGSGEGNPSNDGRFVCVANATQMVVIDMDPAPPYAAWPARRVGPVCALLPCDVDPSNPAGDCRIGNVSISPSGRYVDVKFAASTDTTQDLHRIYDVDPATLALSPHAMNVAALRCGSFAARADGWTFPLKHADMALDPFDGNEDVIVGGRSCPGSSIGHVVKVRLRDGMVTPLTDPSNEPSFQHASARNLERPGWVYVGFYRADGKKFSDEIVAVKLDGSGGVERYAHKRSAVSGCYRCESHPVPSRDGRRILFASNWAEGCGGLCGSSGDIKDYVVSLPLSPVAADPPAAPAAGPALAVRTVRPRPAVWRVLIEYALPTDEPVHLDVIDAAGRRVRTRDLGRPGPGLHEASLERGSDLPSGVYWVRLTSGGRAVTERIVFVG